VGAKSAARAPFSYEKVLFYDSCHIMASSIKPTLPPLFCSQTFNPLQLINNVLLIECYRGSPIKKLGTNFLLAEISQKLKTVDVC
jgi:hypothetical protein